MVRIEYLRFLQTLNVDNVTDGLRKIANLVLQHLDELIPLSTAKGQRVKKIVGLAQADWDTISADIQPIPGQATEQISSIKWLKSLSVGPFRGFSKQEVFDLKSRIVLIYGPNGTGKSSFCEALEFSLLGNVAEAESKRFNQSDYLVNAHTKTFKEPKIIGVDDKDQEVPIIANESFYRFCFVEKNRIDSFSRIAAQAPAKQAELISTLFGLDLFTDFVRNFSHSLDGKYIDLEGVKSKQLREKELSVSIHQQQLQTSNAELQGINKEEQNLAKEYRDGATFSQMKLDIDGDDDSQGAIQQLDSELQKQIPEKSGLIFSEIEQLKKSIESNLDDLQVKQKTLEKGSEQVSFRHLYEALTQLHASEPTHCPACKTPLSQVSVDPYTNAAEELSNLQYLAELEETVAQLKKQIFQFIDQLVLIVDLCVSRFPADNKLSDCKVLLTTSDKVEWWNSLGDVLDDGATYWKHIETRVKELEKEDVKINQNLTQRTQKNTLLITYREISSSILVLQTRKKTSYQAVSNAKKVIQEFKIENEKLIAEVESEKVTVSRNQDIADAYSEFVQKLNTYTRELPGQFVAGLGNKVVELYNSFNRNDALNEKLATVCLPSQKNERLQISFQNDQSEMFDALHVLSEGHIRCIGLSILMAKNLQENCPILIFDDPVNAIDDDHRESIRKTLFEDTLFENKQIIITCHGEEFFKDIQNLLSKDQAEKSKQFSFLPRLDEPHIRVDFQCAPRNYIIAARDHIDKNETRFALAKSRQALESLTKGRVWKYVNKHSDGQLRISMRSAKSPIELKNLTQQLKKKIAENKFSNLDKDSVLTPIETLLGIGDDSREWRYLNKGTHDEEDRSEFDRHTVNQIVSALESLDSALNS